MKKDFMSIYTLSEDGIEEVKRTSFQEKGILERKHLQAYLRDKINVISPDTLIISEEFSEWDESKRRIDLLGIDKKANLVVIELKRTETGDYMELQALRYSAMISAMSFENCISVYQKYIDHRSLELDAKNELLTFLEWDSPLEEDFAPDVKIILASADFSKELTSSVLWLINKGICITCVKLTPYQFHKDILLDVSQIIPLPESEDYLIKIKEKNEERKKVQYNSNRDYSEYEFGDSFYKKSPLVHQVLRSYIEQNPNTTFVELKEAFPDSIQGSHGVFKTAEDAQEIMERTGHKRHYVEVSELIKLKDEIIATSNQWGKGNIDRFVDHVNNMKNNFKITKKNITPQPWG